MSEERPLHWIRRVNGKTRHIERPGMDTICGPSGTLCGREFYALGVGLAGYELSAREAARFAECKACRKAVGR